MSMEKFYELIDSEVEERIKTKREAIKQDVIKRLIIDLSKTLSPEMYMDLPAPRIASNVDPVEKEKVYIERKSAEAQVPSIIPLYSDNRVHYGQNSMITYSGQNKTVKAWAKVYKLAPTTIVNRLNCLHWSIKASLTTPLTARKGKMYTYDNVTLNAEGWGKRLGISTSAFNKRITRGWPEKKVFNKYANIY